MDRDDVLQTLVVRVEEMRDALTGLEAVLSERCPMHAKRLDRVELVLDGQPANGDHPGLISRVGTIESAFGRMNRARARVYAVAGAAVGGLLVALVEKFL